MTGPRPPANGRVPVPDVRGMPGRQALLLGALLVGLIMLSIQLWLLSIALELYLSGNGDEVWGLALASGVVFAGGLMATRVLSRSTQGGRD